MSNPRLSILHIEDDDVAAESVRRSLGKQAADCTVIWAEDGLEGLQILRDQHPTKRIEGPRVIVLDLNMPRMNGFEFLRALRSDDKLRRSVVFVLTTSDSDVDLVLAYHQAIAGYMVKSAVGHQFSNLVQLLDDYRRAIRLPPS